MKIELPEKIHGFKLPELIVRSLQHSGRLPYHGISYADDFYSLMLKMETKDLQKAIEDYLYFIDND